MTSSHNCVTRLEFRTLLAFIASTFGQRAFTTRQLSEELRRFHTQSNAYLADPRIAALDSVKRLSNDLKRIGRMGFVKGDLGPRILHTKSGKPYGSGLENSWRTTDQGFSYLRYLQNPEERGGGKDFRELLASIMIEREDAPQEKKDIFKRIFLDSRPKRPGVGMRFPRANERIVEAFIKYREDSTIRELRQEKEELLAKFVDFLRALLEEVKMYGYSKLLPLIEKQLKDIERLSKSG